MAHIHDHDRDADATSSQILRADSPDPSSLLSHFCFLEDCVLFEFN